MTKRYCDRCGQQIDEGVHAWYVLELHGTDGEFRHKELCEECYELLAEDNYIPRIEQTENSSGKPNNCDACRHNKLEWYSEVCDGCSKAHSNYEPKDEPQTEAIQISPRTDCTWK